MSANLLVNHVQSIRVEGKQSAGGLEVFGLYWNPPLGEEYFTLDEAIAENLLEVTEIDSGGSVPNLKVTNKGDKAVFLMAGEHLSGGKQNRVLNASILVPAQGAVPIPVSCVERGRWAYRSGHFTGSGSSSHSTLRRKMHSQVTKSYRETGTPRSDQGEVWEEVDRKLKETKSVSGTMYLDKAYEDSEPILRNVLEQIPVPEGAGGAVFAFGGKIIGMDLFDRPSTFARLWPKLVRAYAIDAYHVAEQLPIAPEQIRNWLNTFSQARQEVFASAGVGDDVRLESESVHAACLWVNEHPVHLEAFAEAL